MTRIGLAYNQKPAPVAASELEDAALQRPDNDPESNRRDDPSRSLRPMRVIAGADLAADRASARTRERAAASIGPEDEFAEWDDEETIAAVEAALAEVGAVIHLEATADLPERLRATRPDIVFNMAEGLRGVNREAHVPAICEFFGVAYSGSDPFTLSLCLDKARAKEVLAYHGVPTARFALVRSVEELAERARGSALANRLARPPLSALRLPVFVKPVHEGSSKGITEQNFCRTHGALKERVALLLARYRQPVLVEEYLPGAEFTCAVLGNGAAARVLPIVGMNFAALPAGALPVYGYEAKWIWDRPDHPLEIFECPARIGDALRRSIEEVVLRSYHVLACRDWSRIDVRLDAAGVPNVVEVNPLPGILPNPEDNSCFPKAARAAGLSYPELIQACLRFAAERQGVPLPGKAVRARPVTTGRRAAASG